MSISDVAGTIDSYIRSQGAETLAIRGRWGTGKTFQWNAGLRRGLDAAANMPARYAYVSLFGVDGLQDLNQAIFSNAIPKQAIGKALSFQTLKDNLSELLIGLEPVEKDNVSARSTGAFLERTIRQLIPALAQTSLARSWTPFLTDAAFLAVKNHLICIDDFERRGKNLSAADVLGLVSFLKEQRNCKVVLIFNDDAFDEDAQRRYAEYREKVIDLEVEFEPTVMEAVECVFPQGHPYHDRVLQHAIALKLTNIRILQRIRGLLEQLAPLVAGKELNIETGLIASIVLFAWSYYGRTSSGIPLDFIVNEKSSAFEAAFEEAAEEARDVEPGDQEAQWKSILQSYGYLYTDELDVLLAEFIRKGYPDKGRMERVIAELDAAAKAGHARESFKDAWQLFNATFDNNEAQLVEGLTEKFSNNMKFLAPSDLNSVVSLLRDLDRNEMADSLVEKFIDTHVDKPAMFNLEDMWIGSELDPKIQSRFLEQRGLNTPARQIEEIVKGMAERDSWHTDDVKFLAQRSVDEYVEFFKATKSRVVYKYIAVLLRFGQWQDPENKEVAKRTTEALKKIAGESRLNAIRLRKFVSSAKPVKPQAAKPPADQNG